MRLNKKNKKIIWLIVILVSLMTVVVFSDVTYLLPKK
jgi:type IV secretory pathway component VirB8